MVSRIFVVGKAEKDLDKLPKEIREKVIKVIQQLKENPRPQGVRKLTGSDNYYRVRVGDWRIVYELSDKERIITIFRIRHRREAYENF